MFIPRPTTSLFIYASLFAGLLVGCTNLKSTHTPVVDIPRPTSAPTQFSTYSVTTPPYFFIIHPSALPFLQPVNGITASGCPDLTDVKAQTELPIETALQLINALRSGDLNAFEAASDRTYWSSPLAVLSPRENAVVEDIQVHPAIQTPYDGIIRTGCGQETLDLSWWVELGTGALGEHYFLINRDGNWLVWASYP